MHGHIGFFGSNGLHPLGERPLFGKSGSAYAAAMVERNRHKPRVAGLVVAAGRGVRAGGGVPKQYRLLAGRPLLRWSVEALCKHPDVDLVQIVVAEGEIAHATEILHGLPVAISTGGATRQQSVHRGLQALMQHAPEHVLVHDAARPLLSAELIARVCATLADEVAVCPALPIADSLRRGDSHIHGEVSRDGLWRAQTPQGFDFRLLLAAHANAAAGATDDCEVMRRAGHPVRLIAGDAQALKLTQAEDFQLLERMLDWVTVTGSGFDVHRFGAGKQLWLCGVKVAHDQGLIGHSDADVGLHALTDAVLGALGAGDIGVHFPPSDAQWKGASSDQFLAHAARLASAAGAEILHCDVTLICEAPKISPYRNSMIARIGDILAPHTPIISIKATTTEGLGFIGQRQGMAAQALATIRLPKGMPQS